MQVIYITTDAAGGQQQTAYVYTTPGATYPATQASYPVTQATYPQGDYKSTESSQPGMYPNLGPSVQPDAPPAYTEKGQAY